MIPRDLKKRRKDPIDKDEEVHFLHSLNIDVEIGKCMVFNMTNT